MHRLKRGEKENDSGFFFFFFVTKHEGQKEGAHSVLKEKNY